MKKLILATTLATILTGCTNNPIQRNPSSLKNTRFMDILNNIESAVQAGTTDPAVCSEKLGGFYKELYNIDSKSIELNKFSQEQMEDFIRTSFMIRLEIKEKMKVLRIGDKDAKNCLTSIKNIVRVMRYLEDYFIEYSHKKFTSSNKNKGADGFITLEGDGAHFVVNPDFNFTNHKDLMSGDVILSRGNAYSSAAIARIGDDDTQFSHLTLVYKDEKTKKLYTSEAHIEIGNVVAPMKIHIDQKNARTVVFRMKNEKLAHEAGKYMYDHIVEYKKKKKKNIPYDFAMIYQDDSKIFCSEVIYHGYKEASKKLYGADMDIPLYKTTFHPGLIKFLNKIGIKVDKNNINTFDTFGPGEIQFDPRFDIVAEWRNPEKLKDTRFKDAILTKIFQWMEEDGYKFRPTFGNSISHSFAWLMRRSKWISSLTSLDEKFPTNMSVKQMNLFVTLDKVGEALYAELEAKEAKSENPLSFKELFEALDEFKKKDLQVYKKYKADRRKLHRMDNREKHRFRRQMVRPKFHMKFRK
jgi:hypothetical protein